MKPNLLCLIFILAHALIANGQLAIIKDPDGFTNVRESGSINAKVIGLLHNGDVFLYNDVQNGWAKIYYNPSEHSDSGRLEGYVHGDRLLPIEKLPHIPKNGRTLNNNHLVLKNDTITVELITAPFQPKQHLLRKSKDGTLETIDGRIPVGTDGEMPHEKLTLLRITIHDTAVAIPVSAWNDLYETNLENCNVFFDRSTGFMYLALPDNSDGGGSYLLAWIFKGGKYIKRYIDGF